VHEAVYDRFIEGFASRAEKLKIGDGLDTGVQMGPMIAPRRLDAMDAFVSDATAQGSTVVTGGKRIGNKGYFYAPTLLRDVPDTARIISEEPFGPIAPTTTFSHFDDMIERANSLPYGLASFVFTRNLATAHKTEAALEAGMVGVNHMMVSTPETPFGGVNESGYGSESGIEGLDVHLRTKFVTEM
jgi:succinate-semialdehyde dehydrogenase / glutarate-semialdehyde dehydrogenase